MVKIKKHKIINGTIYLMTPLIAHLLLSLDSNYSWKLYKTKEIPLQKVKYIKNNEVVDEKRKYSEYKIDSLITYTSSSYLLDNKIVQDKTTYVIDEESAEKLYNQLGKEEVLNIINNLNLSGIRSKDQILNNESGINGILYYHDYKDTISVRESNVESASTYIMIYFSLCGLLYLFEYYLLDDLKNKTKN